MRHHKQTHDSTGWKCEAGTITFRFDGGDPIPAVYGSSRGDTIGLCGDDDNGYVLLWDLNILASGEHTIEVFADGVLFASATFFVVTPEDFELEAIGELQQRVYDLETEVGALTLQLEVLVEDLANHSHPYLTGRGQGHNNTEASTGSAEF